ncbi:DNA polymerase III subunit beta, partial [Candidatus Saganbacteria bacterium]|nr:DNA polymerase III subunit beta [Candidatus Saganbacteria bacterium]
MEFICDKKDLHDGISIVERIITPRSTLPIIGNILFEANREGLKLSANCLEIGMELTVKAKVAKEGAILLPAKVLSGVVSRLPESAIGFKLAESGMMQISYKQSCFNIHSLPPEEFPALPKVKDGKTFSIPAEVFASMIRQTVFAVSASEDKHVLSGVLFEVGKGDSTGESSNFRLVATDGYRLAKRGEKVDPGSVGKFAVIIPARTLQELSKTLDGKSEDMLKIMVSS